MENTPTRCHATVSYNLAVPNGVLMQNYGKVAESLELEEQDPPVVPAPEECVCRKYHNEGAISFHGHVATADPGFIRDRRLLSYWLKGRKFRCQSHPQSLMSSFEESLDNFIAQACRRHRTEAEVFESWKTKLLQFLNEKCNVLFQDADSPHHTFLSQQRYGGVENHPTRHGHHVCRQVSTQFRSVLQKCLQAFALGRDPQFSL